MARDRIHLYASCWNEERMLPYFLEHYRDQVDRIVVYDDGSTDRSLEILASEPLVEVVPFRTGDQSFVEDLASLYNQCWKASRGRADWVIVCNVDEHLYHPDGLRRYLGHCTEAGYTAVTAKGYQMVSSVFPTGSELLYRQVPHGAPSPSFCKTLAFSPDAVEEIGYSVGRHGIAPTPAVVTPPVAELLLLHFKMLGPTYLETRNRELGARRRPVDLERKFGVHYDRSVLELEKQLRNTMARSVRVLGGALPEPSIAGVHAKPLKLVVNERGSLLEVQRSDDDDFPGFGQVYVTTTLPGVVKAWYRHRTQVDQLAGVSGRFELVLHDGREDSSTFGCTDRFLLGPPEPLLVKIPPGIWHGFRALSEERATMLHLNATAYDLSAPDEDRLPPDTDQLPHVW